MFRVHELHHHVLATWADLKNDLPQVVSFDHHTDILPAFMRYSEGEIYPPDAGNDIEQDIKRLRHDEHFDYALKYNIISKAFIISHTPAATEVPDGMQVLYSGDFPEDEPLNSDCYRQYFDKALEDEHLEQYLKFLPTENYILDIDCDYFKTEKSLAPAKSEIFFELLRNARMITVSLEADWVRLLTFEDQSAFSANHIAGKLLQMYAQCKK